MSISKEKIALIHVARAQLGMVDADYRLVLQRTAGVESSKDLDDRGFDALMAELQRLGFRSVKSRARPTHREGMATPAQIGKIRALWKGWSGNDNEAALGHWLEEHMHVSHPHFLEHYRAGKAIAILIKMNLHPNAKKPSREIKRRREK